MCVLGNLQSRIYQEVYKIPTRTDLELGTKISIKILSVLMQKLGFRLYEKIF